MQTFCGIAIIVVIVATYVMVWALCRAAARADRAIGEARDEKAM
jgi:hypothetical protein